MTKKLESNTQSQRQKFIEVAHKAGVDESESAFEAKLKKIDKAKPKEEPTK